MKKSFNDVNELVKYYKNLKKAKKDISIEEIEQNCYALNLSDDEIANVITLINPKEEEFSTLDFNEADVKENDALKLYLKAIKNFPVLSKDEEIELYYEIKDGNERAKETFINCNLKLVVSIAYKYKQEKIDILDLIQEGNQGLITAVERFDGTKGIRFSTYATFWIRQAITRAIIDKGDAVRIPVYKKEAINKMNKARNELYNELSRNPSDEEIAIRMNDGSTAKDVRELKSIYTKTISLDTPVGEDEESTLGDLIKDDSTTTPGDAYDQKVLKQSINEALRVLTPMQAKIVKLIYGLEDGNPHTLKDIGIEFGCSSENIRQIHNAAISKIKKNPTLIKKLVDYKHSL